MTETTIIHGVRAVREALASGRPISRVFFASDAKVPEAREILDGAKALHVSVERVPLAKLNVLCDSAEHQGVAARISPVEYAQLKPLLASCGESAMLVVLDQVQHPRNVGLIVRSALGAGAAGVVVPSKGGALVDDTVLHASAGAALRLPIAMVSNVAQALRTIKEAGFWIYGLDADGQDNAFGVKWAKRTALVIGNETKGMRGPTHKECDVLVKIPLANGLESLNAAVAASVALFEVAKTLKVGPFSPGGA
jgi:23S rRNA (guanosine2251-2'-O)-methyltransferase